MREIQAALERAISREEFELINRGAVRIDDLRRTLLDNKPQIVHFSGHGTGTDGLVFENTAGAPQIVSTESLSHFFELLKEQVECVLLNACYSEIQAQAIHQHIDCVIGMAQPIQDNAAILFSKGFYDAIFVGRNYADAFRFGCNNIDLNNIPESNIPTIKIRHREPEPEDQNTERASTRLLFIGTAVFGLIISLVGLIQLALNENGLITNILLAFGLFILWVCCAYIYFPSSRIAGFGINLFRPSKLYKRLRRLALAGMIIIPLLSATAFYVLQLPPKNIIVLLADFEADSAQKNYRVTKNIFDKLEDALQNSPDVKIQLLNKAITERRDAISEGKSHKATIVIWGDYGATGTTVQLSPHFEVLRPPKYLPKIGQLEQTAAVSELNSFKLQTSLSNEMVYLSLFTVGLTRYTASDWDKAITNFSAALKQVEDPIKALDQSIVYLYRGSAYSHKKVYDRAIADFNQAIKLDPSFAYPYHNRGLVYSYKEDYDSAIADFNQAIKLDPSDAQAYHERGLAYSYKKDYDSAIADFNQAIKLDPSFAYSYNGRGSAYSHKKEYDRAIADFNQAIKLDPSFAYPYHNRGLAYGHKEDYDRAIADFNQAIKLDPSLAPAYYNRGNTYSYKKDYDRAIADYSQAIKLDPTITNSYYNRGFAYKNKGRKDKAIEDFKKVLELNQGKRISNPIDTVVLGFTQSTNKFKITILSQGVGLTFQSLCG